ncbi:MAG: hypothetical protein ABIS50_17695 [Luteolibacter sp.]
MTEDRRNLDFWVSMISGRLSVWIELSSFKVGAGFRIDFWQAIYFCSAFSLLAAPLCSSSRAAAVQGAARDFRTAAPGINPERIFLGTDSIEAILGCETR